MYLKWYSLILVSILTDLQVLFASPPHRLPPPPPSRHHFDRFERPPSFNHTDRRFFKPPQHPDHRHPHSEFHDPRGPRLLSQSDGRPHLGIPNARHLSQSPALSNLPLNIPQESSEPRRPVDQGESEIPRPNHDDTAEHRHPQTLVHDPSNDPKVDASQNPSLDFKHPEPPRHPPIQHHPSHEPHEPSVPPNAGKPLVASDELRSIIHRIPDMDKSQEKGRDVESRSVNSELDKVHRQDHKIGSDEMEDKSKFESKEKQHMHLLNARSERQPSENPHHNPQLDQQQWVHKHAINTLQRNHIQEPHLDIKSKQEYDKKQHFQADHHLSNGDHLEGSDAVNKFAYGTQFVEQQPQFHGPAKLEINFVAGTIETPNSNTDNNLVTARVGDTSEIHSKLDRVKSQMKLLDSIEYYENPEVIKKEIKILLKNFLKNSLRLRDIPNFDKSRQTKEQRSSSDPNYRPSTKILREPMGMDPSFRPPPPMDHPTEFHQPWSHNDHPMNGPFPNPPTFDFQPQPEYSGPTNYPGFEQPRLLSEKSLQPNKAQLSSAIPTPNKKPEIGSIDDIDDDLILMDAVPVSFKVNIDNHLASGCPVLRCNPDTCAGRLFKLSSTTGCPMCECCEPVKCKKYCELGFQADDQGCPTCECLTRDMIEYSDE